jgi:hypothetical protein
MLNNALGALVKYTKKYNIKLMLIKTDFYTFNVLNAWVLRQNFLISIANGIF